MKRIALTCIALVLATGATTVAGSASPQATAGSISRATLSKSGQTITANALVIGVIFSGTGKCALFFDGAAAEGYQPPYTPEPSYAGTPYVNTLSLQGTNCSVQVTLKAI